MDSPSVGYVCEIGTVRSLSVNIEIGRTATARPSFIFLSNTGHDSTLIINSLNDDVGKLTGSVDKLRERAVVNLAWRPVDILSAVTGITPLYHIDLPANVTELAIKANTADICSQAISCQNLAIFTAAGAINILNGQGFITASTGTGDITLDHHNGEAIASSGAGDVRATQCQGVLRLRTGNGSVAILSSNGSTVSVKNKIGLVNVHSLTCEALSVDCGEGTLSILDAQVGASNLQVRKGGCSFSGVLLPGEHLIHSERGPVRLSLPVQTALQFDLSTGSGEINCPWPAVPVGRRGRPSGHGKRLVGVRGEGIGRLHASTGNGDIVITLDVNRPETQ